MEEPVARNDSSVDKRCQYRYWSRQSSPPWSKESFEYVPTELLMPESKWSKQCWLSSQAWCVREMPPKSITLNGKCFLSPSAAEQRNEKVTSRKEDIYRLCGESFSVLYPRWENRRAHLSLPSRINRSCVSEEIGRCVIPSYVDEEMRRLKKDSQQMPFYLTVQRIWRVLRRYQSLAFWRRSARSKYEDGL